MRRCAAILLALLAGAAGCAKEARTRAELSSPVREAVRAIALLEGASVLPGEGKESEIVDMRGLTAEEFRRKLAAFPGEDVHVWMPGEKDWVLVGRSRTNGVSLVRAMEAFAAATNVSMSVAEVFASYAGTRDDILPAFASDLRGEVVPEWFVTKDVPEIRWLDTAGIDADILRLTRAEIRSMQVVRRLLLEGNMKAAQATDKKGEEAATDLWAKVAIRNPNDPMLLERIDRLNRNAKGFLELNKVLQAMKCYETLVLIQPQNAAAVHNFGMCLKRIGKLDLAQQVLKRAEELASRGEGER